MNKVVFYIITFLQTLCDFTSDRNNWYDQQFAKISCTIQKSNIRNILIKYT